MNYKLARMFFLVSFALFAFVFLSGSATIISGTNQTLNFQSEPPGAQVIIDGQMVGVTPVSVTVPKSRRSSVMFQLDGYQTITRDLNRRYDPITLLSVFWDLSTTDLITGAAFEYEPNSFFITMTPSR